MKQTWHGHSAFRIEAGEAKILAARAYRCARPNGIRSSTMTDVTAGVEIPDS